VKKLIMVFAAIMMLGGGAVSIMKWLEIGPFAPKPEEKAAAGEAPKGPAAEPPRFIDLDALIVPIFHGDEIVATIQISVKLEVTGTANEIKVGRIKPRLNDAYIKDLYSFIPRLLENQERVNVFIIKKRLQMVSDKVAGAGVISDVLVQSITDTSNQR
jgi:flagellar basal body-associated protein FliL